MTNKISPKIRREEIKTLISEKGFVKINKSALGRKYGVSDVMISKDIDIILNEIPDKKIEIIIKKLHIQLIHALYVAETLLESRDENIQLKAVTVMVDIIERYMKFLHIYSKQPELQKFEIEIVN